MKRSFVRFSRRQRAEHVAVMLLFTLLAVTGLPQKFFEWGAARWILDAVGGIDRARWLHRTAGLAFAVLALEHVAGVLWAVLVRRTPLSLVPTRRDFRDAIQQIRYYLGLAEREARFDRFDYRQKFEYWGLILGAAVVIATGLVLLWPVLATRWLPGEVVPAAKVAHSNEGLLALLVVVVWHIYNAHFNPDVFPFDRSIFTGRISRERMEHEHPLELERLERDEP
ncbi:MAG TPA: cytochrome b/b6 domain-containing protein [Candidatus Polarisedimenticolaceae bacterium]|nr:cytochrome b/b6 domain-containing protein [Candidatus Polarisedimenticolaceae bacterium]